MTLELRDVDIVIEDPRWNTEPMAAEAEIGRIARAAFDAGGMPEDFPHVTAAGLTILLTDDTAVQALNRAFRGKDKPTNVLSFATIDDPDTLPLADDSAPFHLGDIAIAYETVAREAEEMNVALGHHLTHLVIHGVLHLLGYDHIDDDEAEHMEALEIRLLQNFGIENPYADANFVRE